MTDCTCIYGRGIGGTILKRDCPLHGTDKHDSAPLIDQLRGRATFCRDRGEIKTPELLEAAADELAKARALLSAERSGTDAAV